MSTASRLITVVLIVGSSAAQAQAPVAQSPGETKVAPAPPLQIVETPGEPPMSRVTLEVGQDRLLDLSTAVRGISVPHPGIADVKMLSSNTQLLVSAKGVGDTYITLLDKGQKPLVLAVSVTRNLEPLRRQIKDLFPDEAVVVSAAGDLVVLSGEVSDLKVPERIAVVARLHAPKVANLVRVRGNQQVQLEVKFAEVSRAGLREMGLSWFHQGANSDGGQPRVAGYVNPSTKPGQFANNPPYNAIPGTGVAGVPLVFDAPINNTFSFFFSGLANFPFSAVLSLMEQNRVAKTLAEPTLVAMTGQEARFLAGGEIPIPIANAFGMTTVTFKKFGIQLKFLPTVLAEGVINLKMESEVSEVDPSLGITLQGLVIPGLTSRQSETTVRLQSGQSFAVAGLLSDKVRSTVSKVPLLGEIPVLGALFRSTQYRRDETELLIVVTARLVKPVAAHDAPLMPGEDELNDPDDFELFLLGRTGRKPKLSPGRGEAIPVKGVTQAGGPSGDLGYVR